MKMRHQSCTNLRPKTALPKPEDLYVNVPSGSGGALHVGVKTDVRKKLNFIGKEGTEIEGTIYTPMELGGTYIGSKNITGFQFNTEETGEYNVLIDASYEAGKGAVSAIMTGTKYADAFPLDSCTWVVGKFG